MKCQVCKYDNQESAKFCENCGHMLENSNSNSISNKPKNKKSKRTAAKKMQQKKLLQTYLTTKTLWIVATVVLGAFLIISIISSNATRNTNSTTVKSFEQRSTNPVVEAKVYDIASKFVCMCGGCDEDSLDECKCNYAMAQRDFIRNSLENSESEGNIISAMISKYGGYKDGNNQALSKAVKKTSTNVELKQGNNNILATYSDLNRIYNSFECPCGQCGITELADCTCGHPRGAIEVKKFIDTQIAKNKFSVDQVIAEVDRVYGGKKI